MQTAAVNQSIEVLLLAVDTLIHSQPILLKLVEATFSAHLVVMLEACATTQLHEY